MQNDAVRKCSRALLSSALTRSELNQSFRSAASDIALAKPWVPALVSALTAPLLSPAFWRLSLAKSFSAVPTAPPAPCKCDQMPSDVQNNSSSSRRWATGSAGGWQGG